MDELSREIDSAPAYSANFGRPQSNAQAVRERLIPRKPILSPEIVETPIFDSQEGHPPTKSPLGHHFPREYEHVQSDDEHGGNMWLPGFWLQFPWRVILPLVVCLACLSGAIAILVRSDGQPVDLRGGTVTDLHKHWSSGDGFWSALAAGRHFNFISLGSIAATLIVIDQPLIQRASTIVSTPRTYLANITANIAPEIPYGYTGYQPARSSAQQVMTQPMIAAFNDYNTQAPITTGFDGCKDSCEGFIEAGGLAVQCSTISGPVQYLQGSSEGPDSTLIDPVLFAYDSPFNVNFTLVPVSAGVNENVTNNTQIMMVVAYTNQSTTACTGNRVQRTCSLRPATLKYHVTITNGSLDLGDITTDATVQSFQPASNTSDTDGGGDYTLWTLGGIYTAAISLFNSNASYAFNAAVASQVILQDTLSNQFLSITPGPGQPLVNGSDDANVLFNGLSFPTACSSNWTDPTNHIISALNEISFRVSIAAGNYPYRDTKESPPPQVITMLATGNINVFHSEHKYMIAMIVLTVAMMGFVVPTFIGWWELGRHVTLDPIEIAKAFDAPILRGPGSNAPLWQLVQDYGSLGIRYGEAEGFDGGQMIKRQLKLGNSDQLIQPLPGTIYR
ncbi:hypothetical protein D0Z07_2842 [Hyphodiscus hymeniophilus]|uniref:Uncharacterized protein n=1 Tax=Hyphodiscus hymeniophilus TaxID=353542 RepID=A0A9P6VMN8_9HELO|nr:hypothetical protein D0Z07_2842 [Hyphodiscus hymeniophilus]